MQAQEAVCIRFFPRGVGSSLSLCISRLPGRRGQFTEDLWAPTSELIAEPGSVLFEVVEGGEYRFEWQGLGSPSALFTDPQELFECDGVDGRAGRLRPRLSTGTVDASLRGGDALLGRFSFEVRSKKLHYRSEYRWMLRDIADHMAELVMHRFAASRASFVVDDSRDARTLYERFEFLRAALQPERLREAFARVVHRPHVQWE